MSLPPSLSELSFGEPRLLWVLVPLFLAWAAAWWLLPRRAARRDATLHYSSLARLARQAPAWTVRLRPLFQGLRLATVALLVLAMARPQAERRETQVTTHGIDILLVLDTSGSMQALDLDADRPLGARRNRLVVAKSVVESFIGKRENDPVGLVVFGAEAFTQCPLTLDHGVVLQLLERVEIGMAGDSTAIGSALATAVKRLKASPAKSKVIILLTDGRNNAGTVAPLTAARIAQTYGIKLYTIAAGTRGKAPFLIDTLLGKQVVYDDVEIDEPMLTEMAKLTGGAYFRAEDGTALAAIYDQIDQLEKTEIVTRSHVERLDRYTWFVVPALALLVLEIVALGTRFRKLP